MIRQAGFTDNHHFIFTCFDTGYHDIIITAYRIGADPQEKRLRMYCYSPLFQDTVYGFGKYGDSVAVPAIF